MSKPSQLDVEHDLIVVGSGIVAIALINQYQELHSDHKILCIERGSPRHDDYISSLQQSSADVDVVPVDTSWVLSPEAKQSTELNDCAGSAFVLGGRSHYWYGWCVQPDSKSMQAYPASILKSVSDPAFWRSARDFLGVHEVTAMKFCSLPLQKRLQARLDSANIVHKAAEFAVADPSSAQWTRPDLLQTLKDAKNTLTLLTDCTVIRLERSSNASDRILTSRGILNLLNKDVKIVLCAGAIPNTSILTASPSLSSDMGLPCHGHIRTHVFAKIEAKAFQGESLCSGLAAVVISPSNTARQFHIQMSAFRSPHPCSGVPRYGTSAGPAQSKELGNDILISCAALGDFDGSRSFFDHLTMELHLGMDDKNRSFWSSMDAAVLKAIQALSNDHASISYWHNDHGWQPDEPPSQQRRSPILVHEGGFTPIDDIAGHLTSDFKIRDCSNAYALSGAMLSGGSFNPTLTLCAFARELARRL